MQVALLAKMNKTFLALVYFLASVRLHMELEMLLVIAGIGTCLTKPVFLILVDSLFMSLQISHSVSNVVTQIATELFFVMNRSNMNVQTLLGFKSFVALITFERAQYVHYFFVLV